MEVGEFGDFLPAYINGIRAETYNAILARLLTFRGRQLMRPNYGSFVYLDLDRVDLLSLMTSANQALEGLEDLETITLELDQNTRIIRPVVRGRFQR